MRAPTVHLRTPGSRKGVEDFSALYAEYAERVLIYLAKRCLDPELAVDLMAETFAQAYAGRRRYRGTTDAEAAAWLFGIARNQLAGYFRRGRAERRATRRLGIQIPVLEADDQARIEELADLEPIRSAVAEHFKRLSQEQRDAVQLRVVDELPYAEVARQLRVSENAARARVSRGLRELARSLNHSPLLKGPIRHDRT